MKNDARVRYTKKVLRESLLGLLETRSIQTISVKEICELAQINRATFYLHYRSHLDLLEQIEGELFADLSTEVLDQIELDIDELTERALDIVRRNYDLCRILFSPNGDRDFLKRAMSVSREKSMAVWRARYPWAPERQIEFLFAFVLGGAVAVIEHWVGIGMEEPPRELGEMAEKVSQYWLRKRKK